ncbi:transporter [Pseudomonas fluorescens]|uniref:transporter n=1 Tax=Pseudomonas fluorescens TaxID=294 RepID=UPI002ACAAFDB|nr:transporter [Pseudomonas fluorescens]MDZ5431920.1 transporter [Pseudomonas fluorescens]
MLLCRAAFPKKNKNERKCNESSFCQFPHLLGQGTVCPIFIAVCLAGCINMLVNGSARAIDVDAGDSTPMPAGTDLGLIYYQHVERREFYKDGHKQPSNARLDSDIGILRAVHFMKLGSFTIDPQVLLPFGQSKGKRASSILGEANGIGDLILTSTIWLVEQPQHRTYLGITPFLYVPTGNYDRNDPLNMGENRWKTALMAGFIQGLGEKWWFDLYTNVTWFGKNDDSTSAGKTLRQSDLYQTQAFFRYNFTPSFDLRVGYSESWGGETRLEGVSQRDRTETSKYTVGAAWFPNPKTQLIVSYGQDLSVETAL